MELITEKIWCHFFFRPESSAENFVMVNFDDEKSSIKFNLLFPETCNGTFTGVNNNLNVFLN